jgi:HD-GYP domain-containing protein (c-di-GMP phosphodiesterase class II)
MDNLSDGGKLDVKTAQRAAAPIVESVMNNRSAMTWLVRMREMSDYLYTHSVSSAIWATVMARHIGMPKESIEAAGLGAMLLDIGKTQLPPELLSKPGPLTKAEMALAHRHVEYGVRILEESSGISPEVLAMVRTHHERHDGSGYPKGLSGQLIPVLGRIGGIVDYYDAVTSERPYAAPLSSYDCLRALNKMAGTSFQAEMVEQFIQSIGFFPPGTLVQLNDGTVAVVVAQNRRHRLKPEILVILDPEQNLRRDFGLIDLQMQVRSIYTDEVLYIEKGLEPGSFGIDPAEYFLA